MFWECQAGATKGHNPRISFSRFGAGFTSADALLPKGYHRQWLEANQDDHMRRIGNEVREKVAKLRTVVGGESMRIEIKGRGAITETDH
jgi:hypothetical protein